MNLIKLIKYFRSGGTFENFCLSQSINMDSEVVEIYMTKPFGINNELGFFEIEKTEAKIEYYFNGKMYFNLFDFFYFLDAIEEANIGISLTDEKLAQVLFDYAINDA
ncbi:hypothetical protein BD847_3140 [Flavobacterium cutihirudinis]|uniref:Uncharacterized protein n=1 Tax=Flavobacterium cutihirudinis TaxID=1265740 RepID=A0A3D9FRU4_9FLAO|nr:hypothetical protein [Flavobacterium cutihirudinis]RED22510.1 hypothetical protein BD847_3140 [Flavobacterium cutihirudinis]